MKTRSMWVCLPVLAGVLVVLPTEARSEEPPRSPPARKWTLQVDPLTTALGFVHVQVERALHPHLSLYVGPSLRLFNGLISEPTDNFIGLGGEMGVRVFLRDTAPRGFWLQIRGVMAHLTSYRRTEPDGSHPTSLGGYVSALGGYTWILDSGLTLSAGAGVQYLHYTVDGQGPKGVLPAAHTTIGFAF